MASGTISPIQRVKKLTVSGTTTASGNYVTSVSLADKIPITVITTSNQNTIGLMGSTTDGHLVVRVLSLNGQALASTAVTVDFYYI